MPETIEGKAQEIRKRRSRRTSGNKPLGVWYLPDSVETAMSDSLFDNLSPEQAQAESVFFNGTNNPNATPSYGNLPQYLPQVPQDVMNADGQLIDAFGNVVDVAAKTGTWVLIGLAVVAFMMLRHEMR